MLPRFLCQTQGAKENEVTMAVLLSSPPTPTMVHWALPGISDKET